MGGSDKVSVTEKAVEKNQEKQEKREKSKTDDKTGEGTDTPSGSLDDDSSNAKKQ